MALSGAGEPQTSYSWLVSLVQLGPAALPDVFAQLVFLVSARTLLVWRIGTVKLMGVGASLEVLKSRIVV